MASQTALCDVNDLRYQLFRVKKGDTLMFHAMRANYLSKIYEIYDKDILNKKGHRQSRGTWVYNRRWTCSYLQDACPASRDGADCV